MMSQGQQYQFDVRVRHRLRKMGVLSQKDVQQYFERLADVEQNAVAIEVRQPALARSDASHGASAPRAALPARAAPNPVPQAPPEPPRAAAPPEPLQEKAPEPLAAPAQQEAAPAQQEAAPAQQEAAPAQQEAAPAQQEPPLPSGPASIPPETADTDDEWGENL
jgi:hypothetical protein